MSRLLHWPYLPLGGWRARRLFYALRFVSKARLPRPSSKSSNWLGFVRFSFKISYMLVLSFDYLVEVPSLKKNESRA